MNQPTKALAVLIVEDLESDAQLLVRLLKKAGYELVYERVETDWQMRAALEKRTWDIVISDYKMPQFDGQAALRILQETGLDIPFIVVSGTIGEETAVSMLKAGAHDYLIKSDLSRLVPAVVHELDQAEIRRERRKPEETLGASEIKLRAPLEPIPAIVYTESVETRETLYISPQVEKLTGYTPAEWIEDGYLWKKMIHPADLAAVLAEDERTSATHEPFNVEYRILTLDGHMLWIRDEAVMIQNQDGTPLFWQGVMHDITERKQAEEALRGSEERFHTLYDNATVGLYRTTPDGRILMLNPAGVRMLGFNSFDEIAKRNLEDTEFDPDYSRKEFREKLEGEGAVVGLESKWIRKDGSKIFVRESAKVFRDENGEILYYDGSFEDITEQKRAEEQLRKLSRAVDQNPASIVITDLQGNIEYVNPKFSQVSGYSFIEVFGKNSSILKSGHTAQEEYKKMWDTITSGNVWQGELLNRKKNGETYWEFATITPVFSEDGKITNFLALKENITERKQAEENIHQRVKELEMLYQSGLALGQLLNPKEIGQKILELLEEKLGWHHTRIRLYDSQKDSLELLDFNQPGLNGEEERKEAVQRFRTLIANSNQGMSGWVIHHSLPLRSGDVKNDPRYVEAYPGIRSGLYVPMKLGERIVGVISIESEQPDAFSEADERLIVTLANQAASAFENARLFEETRQRVMELETLNRISLFLRYVTKQNELLSFVLDEALAILNTAHGSILLYNKATDNLEKTIMRGWTVQVTEPPQNIHEGIAGKVFTSGEIHISRELASDPETHPASRDQMLPNWGGVCLPIRTTQQTLGVMNVVVPSERILSKDDLRLLSILSEMTGAALQRIQLHEQTIRRLEQLNALRAVDRAIVSSLDMRLTLNVLLNHAMNQLSVDAADVLLLHPDSTLLELAAGYGFHTLLLEGVNLSNGFAVRAIMERSLIAAVDIETATLSENPQFEEFWKGEGFASYWCVPLIVKGVVKGVLEVYRRKTLTPDAEWLEFLEALAGQAAIIIDTAQLFQSLQRANMDLSLAYDATIEGWSRAMDLRDHETEGHTLRVTELTVKLARAMHISETQLTIIRRGALLHDIGKMGVPDSILLKEGELTEEEWVMMRKHPQLAYDMLAPIAYLNDALDIPYCHHEKWDGTGYPQGLKGDRIPLFARLFAIVDVWDAITNNRTYRKKWTKQKARQYIKAQSGTYFDPQVVDVFLKEIVA